MAQHLSDETAQSLNAYRAEQERENAYNTWYRQQQAGIYGREVPVADQIAQGAISGDTSAARWHQGLGLGRVAGQMAEAGGNPLAARAAMFGGADAAMQTVGSNSEARMGEVAGARQAQLAAYLRQMQYRQQMDAMQAQKAIGLDNMRRAISGMKRKDEMAAKAGMINLAMGVASGASGAMAGAGMSGGGGGAPAGSMGAAGYANAGGYYDANNWAAPKYE